MALLTWARLKTEPCSSLFGRDFDSDDYLEPEEINENYHTLEYIEP